MRQSFGPGVHEAPGRLRGAPLKPLPSNSPPAQIFLGNVATGADVIQTERPERGQSVPPLPSGRYAEAPAAGTSPPET